MYCLVLAGVNIGFFFGAANELFYKQLEAPGIVKTKKKYKGKIKKLIFFTFLEDSGKDLGNSTSTSHGTG